jgi:hypothetical protein
VTIGALVIGKWLAAIDLVGNDRGGAAPRKPIPERGAVISLIGCFVASGKGLSKGTAGLAVEALARRSGESAKGGPCDQSPHGSLSRSHSGLCQALGLGPFFYPVPNGAL